MSQLFNLYRVRRGKHELVLCDSRAKVRARMARLRKDAHTIKGQPVTYVMETAVRAAEKWKKKPDGHKRSGGDAQSPPRVR